MTQAADLTIELDRAFLARLAALWRIDEPGPPGMARFVDPAVDELRESLRTEPPHRLRVVNLVLLTGYWHADVRTALVPLMSAEAVKAADNFVAILKRIQRIAYEGYSFAQAAVIDDAYSQVREALPLSALKQLERA